VQQRKQRRGWHQHFLGFRARLNCESIPVLPASLVQANFNDPRGIQYLVVWKDERDGKIKEALRLARHVDPREPAATHYVELKRTDGSLTILPTIWRMLPRNGGRFLLLVCSYCSTPCRHVYAWEWDSFSGWSNRVRRIAWKCRSCAELRYSSEGGHLRTSGLFRAFGNLPRPESWFPYVFTSLDAAADFIGSA
jgi:hypothetical protein